MPFESSVSSPTTASDISVVPPVNGNTNVQSALESLQSEISGIVPVVYTDANVATTINYPVANTTAGEPIRDVLLSHDTQIGINATNSATNASNISTLQGQVATNITDIAANASNISTLQGQVATNTNDIATNTAGIAVNANGVATNAANIAINTGNIAGNTTSINNINQAIQASTDGQFTITPLPSAALPLNPPGPLNPLTLVQSFPATPSYINAGNFVVPVTAAVGKGLQFWISGALSVAGPTTNISVVNIGSVGAPIPPQIVGTPWESSSQISFSRNGTISVGAVRNSAAGIVEAGDQLQFQAYKTAGAAAQTITSFSVTVKIIQGSATSLTTDQVLSSSVNGYTNGSLLTSILNNILATLINASTTLTGFVNTAAQSFAGVKTFVNGLISNANVSITNGGLNVAGGVAVSSGTVVTPALTVNAIGINPTGATTNQALIFDGTNFTAQTQAALVAKYSGYAVSLLIPLQTTGGLSTYENNNKWSQAFYPNQLVNQTNAGANGIIINNSLANGTLFIAPVTGQYKISITMQLQLNGGGNGLIYLCDNINGTNVPNSGQTFALVANAIGGVTYNPYNTITYNTIVDMTAGQQYSLWLYSLQGVSWGGSNLIIDYANSYSICITQV